MPDMTNIDPGTLYSMFKGEPGTRKSTQALSYPLPQYWISTDLKMRGLNIPMRKWGINPKEIHYDDYLITAGKLDPIGDITRKLEQFQVSCPYKTIIVDSVTTLADLGLRQTLKKKKGKGEGKIIGGISVNSVEDFNAESAILSDIFAVLKDIHIYSKVNIILIAHVVQTEQRELSGKTHMSRVIVTAAKKIAAKIPAICDEVYHFNINQGFIEGQGGDYALLTTHTGDDFARTTLPLKEEIVFKDKPIYSNWIKPAIDEMKKDPPKTF